MPFPPVYTFIGFPYAATPSLLSGASFNTTYWPLSHLTDGSGRTAWRCANTTGSLRLTLSGSLPCNFLAIFGHNFDRSQVLLVQAPGFSRGVGVRQPGFWLDLRTLSGANLTTSTIDISWTANSRPVSIGEITVGLASTFNGTLDPEPEENIRVWQTRELLEYGKLVSSSSGVLSRGMSLRMVVSAAERATLDSIHTTAASGSAGTRVVVIPSTHRNDAWLVEWPGFIEKEYEKSDRNVKLELPLVEETFGVR